MKTEKAMEDKRSAEVAKIERKYKNKKEEIKSTFEAGLKKEKK